MSAIEIGKLTHDSDMRQFFVSSAYSVPFMYAVMTAEIVASASLLWRGSRVSGALTLSCIMLSAIGTHIRNRDPLSDSADALSVLALAACVAAVGVVRAKRRTEL
jgi:hypothetical protein